MRHMYDYLNIISAQSNPHEPLNSNQTRNDPTNHQDSHLGIMSPQVFGTEIDPAVP